MQNKSIKADFFPFTVYSSESSLDILRKTKVTIKSTFKYSNYMKKYTKYVNNIKALDKIYALHHTSDSLRLPSLDNLKTSMNTITNFKTRNKTKKRVKILDNIKNPVNVFKFYFESFENFIASDNLVYDLPLILSKDYKKVIKNRIEMLKLQMSDNMTNRLSKCLNNVEISLNSLQLELINKTDPSKQIILYNLPLSLLPIFYYIDIQDFKLLLIRILKFNKDESSMFFNDEDLFEFLRTSKIFSDHNFYIPKNKIFKFNWITTKYIFDVFIK
jgi:hypothetical protein